MLVLGLPAGSAQQKAFLHPVSWVQPLPCRTMHLVGATPLWPPQTHTGLCPLKIQQQKCVRRWELGQLGGEGQWLTGFSWTPSHCILLWARLTVLWTLPHPFYVQFLRCILTLRVITTELHSQFSIATALQHAVFQLSHLDTASTGMKFTLKQNCVLVRFLVPLKGRSNPDISLPHFNYSQCFLHASNLPWMQQSILRTRIGEQHLKSSELKREKRYEIEKKPTMKISPIFSCQLISLHLPFPSAASLTFFCKPYSSFICKQADPEFPQLFFSSTRHLCPAAKTFILPGTHSNIINCSVLNTPFSLMTLLQIYSSNTVKSTHIWIIP